MCPPVRRPDAASDDETDERSEPCYPATRSGIWHSMNQLLRGVGVRTAAPGARRARVITSLETRSRRAHGNHERSTSRTMSILAPLLDRCAPLVALEFGFTTTAYAAPCGLFAQRSALLAQARYRVESLRVLRHDGQEESAGGLLGVAVAVLAKDRLDLVLVRLGVSFGELLYRTASIDLVRVSVMPASILSIDFCTSGAS
jgi:hypothetical protein